MVTTSDGDSHTESIAQAIRSRDAIIVTVIDVKNDGGISDLKCEAGVNEHWKISPHGIGEVNVGIPSDFGNVVDSFELLDGEISDIPNVSQEMVVMGTDYHGNQIMGSSFTIQHVSMKSSKPTRLYILASNKQVRKDIQNNL